MNGLSLDPIFDLVAATRSRSGDEVFRRKFADRGEKNQLANFLRQLEMLCFIAEGTRHPAATGGDNSDVATAKLLEDSDRGSQRTEGFLVAVAMEVHGFRQAMK